MREIVFWGATGQARVLRELVKQLGYRLVALFDNDIDVTSPFSDVPIYFGEAGFMTWLEAREGVESWCLVAIGGAAGRDRLEIQGRLSCRGLRPATAVHPTAFVAEGVVLGAGSQVLARSAVCVDVVAGEACIINTSASVDHECVLGRGVHIAPGATLAGCARVGDYSMVGAGAVVLPRIRIGSNVVVGAGAVVTRDIPDDSVAYGNPARVRRANTIRR